MYCREVFSRRGPFLRKELDNKHKIIDNLLNIINYIHRNSNEPGKNLYKNTNAQPVQTNATTDERFQHKIEIT